MSFAFGFSYDDDDEGDIDGGSVAQHGETFAAHAGPPPTAFTRPVQAHSLEELFASLPERISYTLVKVESPTGKVIYLPRRDLYDVKVQLMCEGEDNDDVIDQLEKSDIRSGVYEGGFKTWECSLDLASLLLDRGPRKDIDELIRCDQVIELGAGTALPTLVLFQHAYLSDIPITFTLADYNDAVLRLVTLPNILLMWASISGAADFPTPETVGEAKGDWEISPSVVDRFTSEIKAKNINLNFLSGAWSPQLASLIPASAPDMGTLVLAAETIYSPESTTAFVSIMVELLQRVKMSKAMIGAKRVYFGVGGSVDGLKEACREKGAVAYEIENHGVPGMASGVGRALVEVQMY